MSVTPVDVPDFSPPPPSFSHVSVAEGSRIVHLSGQVGQDAATEIVPGGLRGQTAQALRNVRQALAAAGATPADITHLRAYVRDWRQDLTDDFSGGIADAAADGVELPRCSATLIGVQSLFTESMLVEIEVVAVLG